jgi:hypothetical protein
MESFRPAAFRRACSSGTLQDSTPAIRGFERRRSSALRSEGRPGTQLT